MNSLTQIYGAGGTKTWVSGRVYQPGTILLSPADNYQAYVRVTAAGSGTTDPSSDTTNYRPFGARAIKSIQRGVQTMGTATTTITISAVVTSKTVLMLYGGLGAVGGAAKMPSVTLTNSTTITLVFSATPGDSNNHLSWQVVEYY